MANSSVEHMYVMRRANIPTESPRDINAHYFVAPIWHVTLVDEVTDADMKLTLDVMDTDGYEVMTLLAVNTHEIKHGDVLKRLMTNVTPKPPHPMGNDAKLRRTK